MENDKRNKLEQDMSLSLTTTFDLRGKQSVRATFRLSEECIDAISIIAAHLGIKQKSIFDHLMEDAELLTKLAREFEDRKLSRGGRIQKTYVVSRRSLYTLDQISGSYNAPRDALIEYSVHRLLPIIDKEREKHAKRKKILEELTNHFTDGTKVLSKIGRVLGNDDFVYKKFEMAMTAYASAYDSIKSFVEKGKIIESFIPGKDE